MISIFIINNYLKQSLLCLKLRYGIKSIFTQRKGVDLLSTPNMTELFFSI